MTRRDVEWHALRLTLAALGPVLLHGERLAMRLTDRLFPMPPDAERANTYFD